MANAPASLPVIGNHDERAYAIVHNYLRTQCRPKVHVVSVTDIITHFLLTAPGGYGNLRGFIDNFAAGGISSRGTRLQRY
jgi:hypothetical protein